MQIYAKYNVYVINIIKLQKKNNNYYMDRLFWKWCKTILFYFDAPKMLPLTLLWIDNKKEYYFSLSFSFFPLIHNDYGQPKRSSLIYDGVSNQTCFDL